MNELLKKMREIIDGFDEYARVGGDPWGWDWSTMRLVFPDKVEEYLTLKAEYMRRYADAQKEEVEAQEEAASETREAECKGYKHAKDIEIVSAKRRGGVVRSGGGAGGGPEGG